jgi:hypothetical protein
LGSVLNFFSQKIFSAERFSASIEPNQFLEKNLGSSFSSIGGLSFQVFQIFSNFFQKNFSAERFQRLLSQINF